MDECGQHAANTVTDLQQQRQIAVSGKQYYHIKTIRSRRMPAVASKAMMAFATNRFIPRPPLKGDVVQTYFLGTRIATAGLAPT